MSGCFNGTLCLWNGDDLIQCHLNAHPYSMITDIDFCGHSSNIISLGSDKRLCIWTYSSLQIVYELNDLTSNCFTIHRTNYLFYTQLNCLFISDVLNPTKITSQSFEIPDEWEMTIEKVFYLSQSETLIVQNFDRISAMHLPQRLFLHR